MTRITGTRLLVISAVVLAVASLVTAIVLVSRSSSSTMAGMAGMDHGSGDAHASSSAPTTAADAHGEMPGMDMPESAPTPTPSMAADMPGMDHGDAPTGSPAPTPTSSGDMPGMDMSGTDSGSGDAHGTTPGHDSMATEAAPTRPLVPVLGTFGGGTSAVLLAAGFLRRKDRIANQAKQAARATRRSAK